uniref:Phospholipase A2 n=1 Tax=Vombatus ursinus TaxID=29139 RepID=A0A4X2M4B7_VOMUR
SNTLYVLICLCISVALVQGNLIQFKNMIGKLTGKNALIDYGFYGCHCGWGGKGTPLDATDRCCFFHDCCYSKLRKKGCIPKIQTYNYEYQDGFIICGSGNYCQKQICVCDRIVAYCMKKNLKSYSVKYRYFKTSQCSEDTPKC